jgi:hypothetical protein
MSSGGMTIGGFSGVSINVDVLIVRAESNTGTAAGTAAVTAFSLRYVQMNVTESLQSV